MNERACPYRGLVPYFEEDADYFFGRQSDIEIIVANVLTTRVTLFYGASGVGKSSVLYAGVVRELRQRARKNLQERGCAECIPVPFSAWRDDPKGALLQRVETTLRDSLPASTAAQLPAANGSLLESFRAWSELAQSDIVLLLDQFEEYFLYRKAHAVQFGDELTAAVTDPTLRVNVLISLREDALAQLDTFKSRIPSLFDNCLRLEHLTEAAARQAIEEPLKLYNARRPPNEPQVFLEPELVNQVLAQVRAGAVQLPTAGSGTVAPAAKERDEARVEAPYLQMVLIRLWREDVAGGPGVLRAATLERLGGAKEIVRTHLDTVMARLSEKEQTIAAHVFRQLVTASGTKIAHYVIDLSDLTGEAAPEIQKMFDRLDDADSRVLRDVTPPWKTSKRYEIFHDLLAVPITDWRQRFAAEQQRKKTRRRLMVTGTIVGLAGLTALSIIIVQSLKARKLAQEKQLLERQTAEERAEVQRDLSRNLTFSQQQLSAQTTWNPEQAARDSVMQKEAAPDEPLASPAPLSSVPSSRPPPDAVVAQASDYISEKLFPGHERDVWTARYSSEQRGGFTPGMRNSFLITAGRDKTARVWDLVGDNDFAFTGHEAEVNSAVLNPKPRGDGTGWFAATGSDDARVGLWRPDKPAKPTFLTAHTAPISSLIWSENGDWLVSTSKDRRAIIWDATGPEVVQGATLSGHTGSVWHACLVEIAEGGWIVTASGDGTARLWNFPTGEPVSFSSAPAGEREVLRHGAPVRRASMDTEARWIVTAGSDGRAVVWDRSTGARQFEVVHGKAVRDVAFKAGESLFVTASADNTAQVWDAKSGAGVVTLRGHTAPVFSARFTPHGPGVVTISWDQTARLWNYETKECVAVLRGHLGALWSVEFAPSGKNFTTTSADGTARLWELRRIPGGRAFLPATEQMTQQMAR